MGYVCNSWLLFDCAPPNRLFATLLSISDGTKVNRVDTGVFCLRRHFYRGVAMVMSDSERVLGAVLLVKH